MTEEEEKKETKRDREAKIKRGHLEGSAWDQPNDPRID